MRGFRMVAPGGSNGFRNISYFLLIFYSFGLKNFLRIHGRLKTKPITVGGDATLYV